MGNIDNLKSNISHAVINWMSYVLYHSRFLHYMLYKIDKHGVTPEKFHQVLVRIYTSTNGVIYDKLFTDLEKVTTEETLALRDRVIASFEVLRVKGHIVGQDLTREILDSLLVEYQQTGYTVLPFKLEKRSCDQIVDDVSKKPGVYRDCFDGERIKSVECLDIESPQGVIAQVDILDHSTDVTDDVLESEFFEILAEFLMQSRRALLTIATVWWSFPTKNPSSEGAQKYHFDLDGLKWSKVFIYLTDVTVDSGPHSAILGSHMPRKKSSHLLSRGYVRVEDSEATNDGNEKTFVDSKGTIILGDTKCWHKGSMVKNNNRAIFQLEYSCHPISSRF